MNFRFLSELLTKDLRILFFANLAGSFGDGLFAYVLPYYMRETLNASPVEVGILYATANVCVAVTLLAGGFLADKYDRKKILILSWLSWAPAPLIFAFASNWTQMLPGMLLWGILFSQPTSTAYIVTTVDKKKVTLAFTAISSAWSLGYVFSPAIGGYLAQTVNMQFVFFLASIFYASAGVILCLIRKQTPPSHKQQAQEKNYSKLELLKDRRLLTFSAFFAMSMFTMLLFRPFIPTFVADAYGYRSFEIGVLGSFFFLGSAILGIALGRVGDKYKKSYAFAAALALTASSLVLLLLTGNFHVLLVTHLLIGASYLAWPLMNAIVGSCAPETSRALWVAIPQAVSMFCAIFAPYLGGVLYEASPYYPFMFGAAVLLLLAGAALAKLRY
ncbi:MAG: MFS transporter [Candidatus Bathyarchaeota archaeon]|nr:MFS transporter [Candidatus Bathyarchaeota archaeon]